MARFDPYGSETRHGGRALEVKRQGLLSGRSVRRGLRLLIGHRGLQAGDADPEQAHRGVELELGQQLAAASAGKLLAQDSSSTPVRLLNGITGLSAVPNSKQARRTCRGSGGPGT